MHCPSIVKQFCENEIQSCMWTYFDSLKFLDRWDIILSLLDRIYKLSFLQWSQLWVACQLLCFTLFLCFILFCFVSWELAPQSSSPFNTQYGKYWIPVLVGFLSCYDKMPEKHNLKWGKSYFDSWFQSIICWYHCFGPMLRLNFMVVCICGIKGCSLMEARKQRKRGRGRRQNIPFKGVSSMTYFLWIGRIDLLKSPLPPNSSLSYEWINPLVRPEHLWSNYLPTTSLLNIVAVGIKPSTHKLWGDISDLSHSNSLAKWWPLSLSSCL
jgi:hypothetical protein